MPKTDWSMDESFESLLWPIIHAAGEIPLPDGLADVMECPSCGWLFLDTSKEPEPALVQHEYVWGKR